MRLLRPAGTCAAALHRAAAARTAQRSGANLSTMSRGEKSPAVVPSRISLTFLSGGGPLSVAKSLCVETTNKCYLINSPEGMSRLLQSSRIATSKIRHIFVTGNQWQLCAGLIGTCLDINSCGVQSAVTLHGPAVAQDVANMMLVFSDTSTMNIDYNSCDEFTDEGFCIQSLSVACDEDGTESFCYLFKPAPTPPKIDISKALQLEFPVTMFKDGVTVGRIKAGETIETPDGRKFDGKELLLQQAPTKHFLVADCATVAAARQLSDSRQLQQWASSHQLGLVVHLADAGVVHSDEYRRLLQLFGPTVQHVLMDGKCQLPPLLVPYQMQLLLHSLHAGIFPLMDGHRFMSEDDDPSAGSEQPTEKVTSSSEFLVYDLRPPIGFRGCARDKFSEQAFRDKVFESEEMYITRAEFKDEMRLYRERVNLLQSPGADTDTADAEFPFVHFLGTSSSHATKHRNVSSIMLQLSKDTNILLDCGEGTLMQLLCFYGPEACQQVLRSLKAICVSHMHLDHQSGLLCVLAARRRAFLAAGQRPEPCAFVGPRGFLRWREFFSAAGRLSDTDCIRDLRLYFCEWLCDVSPSRQQPEAEAKEQERMVAEFRQFVADTLQLQELQPVPVRHSTKVAFGFSIRGSGRKLVYSGDTTPCESLVEAGADCDLLIHEATFDAELQQLAAEKKHSTVRQALQAAQRMRARHTVLTHFSARYAAYVPLADSATPAEAAAAAGGGDSSHGFAYDHMRLRLGADLRWLPLLAPMYRLLFAKHFLGAQRRSRRAAAAGADVEKPPGKKKRRQQRDT